MYVYLYVFIYSNKDLGTLVVARRGDIYIDTSIHVVIYILCI
jgi:hypothetical protein